MGVKLGINLWSQASDWPSFLAAGRRAEELGYETLWTWDHVYAIFGDPHQPIFEGYTALAALAQATERIRLGLFVGANTFRNPGVAVKAVTTIDHISERPGDPGHRRGVVRARAPRVRHGLRQRVRAAARLAGRGGPGDAVAARRRVGDEPGRRSLCLRRPAPRPVPGPGPPADHDRRWRREEDPPHRRRARRHVERLRHARGRSPTRTPCCAPTAPTWDATRPRSSARSAARSRSARPKPTPSGSASTSSSATARPSSRVEGDTSFWTGTPEQIAETMLGYVRVGFETFIVELPAPYDAETMESLATVVRPMVDAAMTA